MTDVMMMYGTMLLILGNKTKYYTKIKLYRVAAVPALTYVSETRTMIGKETVQMKFKPCEQLLCKHNGDKSPELMEQVYRVDQVQTTIQSPEGSASRTKFY